MGVIMHNNIPYGGGSTIEPNPQESATEQLETLGIDGDVYEIKDPNAAPNEPTFTEASTRENLNGSGETIATLLGKIKKWFSDLKTVAFTGAYSDLSGTPTIPTVNDGTLTIKQNNNNLGTFTANQSTASNINIECAVPSDVEGSNVATGNPLTITDAAGIKAEKIEIGFESKQDKHGYNSVWVGGAGKNILPLTIRKIKPLNTGGTWTGNNYVIRGVTYSFTVNDDGSISRIDVGGNNTTSSYAALYLLDGNYEQLYAGMIYVSGSTNSNGSICYMQMNKVSTSGGSASIVSVIPNNTAYEFDSTDYRIQLILYFRPNTNANGYVYYPMVSKTNTRDFEPYSNISTITGYNSIIANRCGKNLINPAKITESSAHVNSYIYSDGDGLLVDAGQYTFSASQQCNGLYVSEAVEGASSIAYVNNSDVLKFTIPNKMYIKMQSWRNSGVTGMTYQLEKGNQATTYEAYKPKNVTVQLNQTLYGGKLTILQDGSADIDVDTGFDVYTGENTENWVFSYQNSYYQAARENTTMKNSLDAFTNEFENIALSDRGTKNGFVTYSDTTIRVALLPSFGITSVAQWQTFLASHNLQVAYKLATPFTLHLSPVETLTLLQGINNVWTDGTTLSLTYQPDNAIGQAKGTAQELVDSASTWKLFAESANANIALPTNCKELYICVIYVTGSTSAIMYNFHILPDILTKATSYFRQGDYYTPDYFSRCEIRIRKTSNVYDTRVECLYMNNTTDRAGNTTVKVYYR